ncbi:MAG: PHB depolymerase family esterase [Pseudomonadota bacterium]
MSNHFESQDGWTRFQPTDKSVGGILYSPCQSDGLPLIVALHGCSQTAADFALGTKLTDVASREGVAILFPESQRTQDTIALNPFGCWVWWAEENQGAKGEAQKIMALVDRARTQNPAISQEPFCVTGLSSGAAMAVILAVSYTDQVAALASHAGVAFAAAELETPTPPQKAQTPSDAFSVAKQFSPLNILQLHQWVSKSTDTLERAPTVKDALGAIDVSSVPAKGISIPPALIVYGRGDAQVDPDHSRRLAVQLLQIAGYQSDKLFTDDLEALATEHDKTCGGQGNYNIKISEFRDAKADSCVRLVAISELGHAWSGGSAGGSYTDPLGPDATQMTWEFFKQVVPHLRGH